MPDAVLSAQAINKSFGPVVALQDVSIDLARGEVTGLVGDNGAGRYSASARIAAYSVPMPAQSSSTERLSISRRRRRRARAASRLCIKTLRSSETSRSGPTSILAAN